MADFHFVPSARLQRILARELIADANVAVLEFVKNAYDAGATEMGVNFLVRDRPRERQELRIADNGVGMDAAQFERNWMRPGYSEKAVEYQGAAPAGTTKAAGLQRARVPVGEKGLGRLAAGRLGDEMEVFTRRSIHARWLHVSIRWDAFDNMDQALSAVPIPYDFVTEAPAGSADSGTTIVIRGLTLNWSGFIPGRKVAGRSDSRLGRLRDDLRILLLPLSTQTSDFTVAMDIDMPFLSKRYGGVVPRGTLSEYDYRYDFSVSGGEPVKVRRTIRRSSEISADLGKKRIEKETVRIDASEQERPVTLRSGPFKGSFLYLPKSASRLQHFGFPAGVFVYRDGIRVDPYGHGADDWLGAQARKASRQGYAAIQPKFLFGHVQIGKASNPNLVDMPNRQGLVENDAEEDLVGHSRAEFSNFEDLVFAEFVKPGWEPAAAKEQRAAERATTFSAIIVRTLLHSLRQSTAGLGAEMGQLSSIVQRETAIPEALRNRLGQIVSRSQDHIQNIDETLDRTIGFYEEDRTESIGPLRVADVLADVLRHVRPLAEQRRAKVDTVGDLDETTVFERSALTEALTELVRNAIEAPRVDEATAFVRLSADEQDGTVRIFVQDNATGVSPAIRRSLFRSAGSTKGRPGGGLIHVRELLALYGGTCELTQSSGDGSKFVVTVPAEPNAK